MATTKPVPAAASEPEALPQSGGSYIRQPDGSLLLQKPKAELSDLVAAKRVATEKPIESTEE